MSMFRFIKAIVEGRELTVFGDGTQRRDFTFVGDIAEGVIASLKPVCCRVFNLGADSPVSILSVIETIERLAAKKALVAHGSADPTDPRATWADITRAGKELGWEPSTSIEEGICESLRWYLANRQWACNI